MAADWIKMRGNLWDDPRVSKICDLTDCGEAQIVGALYWLWATADQHTENGIMPGLTLRQIDRKTGTPGFADALVAIGWLADHPEGVRIVHFEEHNGASAKRRSADAQRKAGVRSVSACDADISQTACGITADNYGQAAELEEEKEEEKETTSLRSVEPPKRASRKCPKSFEVTAELIDWAAEKAPGVNLKTETDKLRDHTFKTAHSDWEGAWRNWIRRAAENLPKVRAGPQSFAELNQRAAIQRAQEFAPGVAARMPGEPPARFEYFEMEDADVPALESP